MDLKIHNLQQISQPERITQTPEADGSFRFTLLSNIEESELQAALSGMLCAAGGASEHRGYQGSVCKCCRHGNQGGHRQPFTQVQP